MSLLGWIAASGWLSASALILALLYYRHELGSVRSALAAFQAAQAGQVALDQTLAAQVTKAREALAERQKAEAHDDALAVQRAAGDPAAAAALLNKLHAASPGTGPRSADPVSAPGRTTVP